MRIATDIDFSLVMPTRNRINLLKSCLDSFYSRAMHPHRIETILIADHCDSSMRNFSDFILQRGYNVRICVVARSQNQIRDYNNYGTQASNGRYIWMLNDDYEMATDHWDALVIGTMEAFLADKKDRVAYVILNDSTHHNWGESWVKGCCCPILTRESVEALNGIMPGEINSWGADIALFNIFRKLAQDRIVDMISGLKVLHHCRHTGGKVDETARHVESISRKMCLTADEEQVYIKKLNQIMHHRPVATR